LLQLSESLLPGRLSDQLVHRDGENRQQTRDDQAHFNLDAHELSPFLHGANNEGPSSGAWTDQRPEHVHAANDCRGDGLQEKRAAANAAAEKQASEVRDAAMAPASAAMPPPIAKAAILLLITDAEVSIDE
jgi:hypothetical protein